MGYKVTTPTGSIGPDSLRVASSGDARRTAKRGPGAAAPGAFWELFCGEKFPAGGLEKARDTQGASRLMRLRTRGIKSLPTPTV